MKSRQKSLFPRRSEWHATQSQGVTTVHQTRMTDDDVRQLGKGDGIGRRDVLRLGAAGLVAIGLGGAALSTRAAEGVLTTLTPGEAPRMNDQCLLMALSRHQFRR